MGLTTTPSIILEGAKAAFIEKLNTFPEVYKNHCMEVPAVTKENTYVFPGHMPVPRAMVNGRNIQGFRDFKFTLSDNTYELSLLIDLEDFEDDQVGGIRSRFLDLAEVFGTYKDQLFASLLAAGAATAPPINSADNVTWATFYEAGGTIGDSGALTNDFTAAATAGHPITGVPLTGDILEQMSRIKALMLRFTDDQGRVGFNAQASTQMSMVVPPEWEVGMSESMTSAIIIGEQGTGGSRANPQQGFATWDVLPYLSLNDAAYVNFLGSERKPFIYQNRMPLQVEIDTSPLGMQERNGVLVLCRERFVIGYGDPRRSSRMVFT